MTKGGIVDCTEFFKVWIQAQVDAWLHERESWDMLLEDGEITEEQLEYIQNNLKLVDCVIKTK